MTFWQWLKNQRKRQDPIGDLARYARTDKGFPRRGDEKAHRDYLESLPACPGALKAMGRAWNEYRVETTGCGSTADVGKVDVWVRGRFALPFNVHLKLECTEEQFRDMHWLRDRVLEAGKRELGSIDPVLDKVELWEILYSLAGPVADDAESGWEVLP
jgi:uncharacterized protein YozE (UPF0346 family)